MCEPAWNLDKAGYVDKHQANTSEPQRATANCGDAGSTLSIFDHVNAMPNLITPYRTNSSYIDLVLADCGRTLFGSMHIFFEP